MTKNTKPTNGVWFMELYKFGCYLKVAGRTETECLRAMKDEYIKSYADYNKLDFIKCGAVLSSPVLDEYGEVDEYDEYNEFAEYYRQTFEDERPYFYEFGKVEWE